MTQDAAPRRRDLRSSVVLLAVAVLAALLTLAAAWGRDRADTSAPEGTPDVLVTYARDGGITGERTRLTVAASGDVTLDRDAATSSESWTRRLPPDRMDALRAALERSGFHDLESSYRHSGVCADCIVDTVTYRGHSVRVQGSAVPAGLAEVLRLLGKVSAGA